MVTIRPDTFDRVHFEAEEIAALATELIGRIEGLPPGIDLEIVIDEDAPTTRWSIASLDPLVIELDGGCLEDTRNPQHFGRAAAATSLGAALRQAADRLDESFGAPPVGEPTDAALRIAWLVSCVGRNVAIGIDAHAPRYRYDFRNRVGFSDAADARFDRLWALTDPTWEDIVAAVDAGAA